MTVQPGVPQAGAVPRAPMRPRCEKRIGNKGAKRLETHMRRTLALPATLLVAVALASGCAMPGHKKEVISTKDAPEAIGPYSQAIRHGPFVFLAGQIPIDPKTNQL